MYVIRLSLMVVKTAASVGGLFHLCRYGRPAPRGTMLSEEMMKSMGGNCINSAVPMKKYMNFCQLLNRDADPRLMEWIKCVHAADRTCNGP